MNWTEEEGCGVKTEDEIRQKLAELLALDCTLGPNENVMRASIGAKVAACKTLLWVLGVNEDDHWFITALPGPPLDTRLENAQ